MSVYWLHILFYYISSPVTGSQQDECDNVCQDLPADDLQPVCMMYSRYKKTYKYFVNLCHARRTACQEKLVLQLVVPMRCMKSQQFFMPL